MQIHNYPFYLRVCSVLSYPCCVDSFLHSICVIVSRWLEVDSWGLGCLIFELFSTTKLSKTEELRNTGSIPKSLLPDYQRLLSSTPSRRLNSAKLVENSEYFHNKLVETIQFMDVLNLKDSVEKDSFFRKLPNLAEQLPRQIVLKKLLPMLASSLEFSSAAAPALNSLLKMGSWLSEDEFRLKVLPTLVKLFASSDRAIRVGLLQHIEQYGHPACLLHQNGIRASERSGDIAVGRSINGCINPSRCRKNEESSWEDLRRRSLCCLHQDEAG